MGSAILRMWEGRGPVVSEGDAIAFLGLGEAQVLQGLSAGQSAAQDRLQRANTLKPRWFARALARCQYSLPGRQRVRRGG